MRTMSSGGAAGVVTMKSNAVFSQSSSHLSAQHTQPLQASNTFNQQMQQQQHLLQQQRTQQPNQAQHPQLQRLSQPHTLSSVHSAQSAAQAAAVNNAAQQSVFSNAEFFQTLQQTAAALPTVLPYDQSQYIGQLMYFPYPTAAAAAANGLFGSTSMADSQHMTVCSTAPGAQATIVNQVSSNANQLIGGANLVSATPTGMVTLNHAGVAAGQIQGTNHLLAPGGGIVGLGSGSNNVSATPTLAPASLAPLFTTAHFYPQQQLQSQQQQSTQPQVQLQHPLQQHPHTSLQMQHVQPLPGHVAIPGQPQQPQGTTVLLPGSIHPAVSQMSIISSQQPNHQPQVSTPQRLSNNSGNGNCERMPKIDGSIHSTPTQTPIKQSDQDVLDRNSQLGNQQQNQNGNSNHNSNSSNGGLEVSSSTPKRDNNGTGHFVCGVCGREFGMRCRLIAHTRRHTGERPFPCADCGRAFSDRGNLQRHRYTHSSQPRFHCSVCGKSFRQASCLSNHRRFHCAGATGRPCPFCQRSFRSSSSLQMHIRWKHRADAAAAVAAAAAAAAASGTSSISEAFTHLPGFCSSYVPTATMNGIPTMSFNGSSLDLQGSSLLSAAAAVAASAAIVNNSCVSSTPLNNHVSSSQGAFVSSGTATTSAATITCSSGMTGVLDERVITSTGSPNKRKWRRKPKPKQAQNAFGKLDANGLNILAGINLSEGIDVNAAAAAAGAAAAAVGGPVPLDRKGRPCNFPCPACPRRFAFQCRLAAHLRCHTNIRPFICIDCGRAFTQRGYLVRHAAVHKLDRPFTCSLCDRSYKHYGSLVNHRRTHNKLNASSLGGVALLSSTGMENMSCVTSATSVGGLSSLEEVVNGALGRQDKQDGSDSIGVSSAGTTTITLLPVTKVEEILPGDLGTSMHQMCLPSVACAPPGGNVNHMLTVSDQHQSRQQSDSESNTQRSQPPPPPHQLTATAVWPILTSGSGVMNQGQSTQLITQQQQQQSIANGSHFSTLTISPTQLTPQGGPQSAQQLSIMPSQQQQMTQSNNALMLSGANGTSAFVTLPVFSSQAQVSTEPPTSNVTCVTSSMSNHHQHHAFPCTTTLVNDTSTQSSDSSRTQHHSHAQNQSNQQQQSISQAVASQIQTHPISSLSQQQQTTSLSGDTNATPVLHVLQPSPSIFFSPYYLPHTATSQM